MKLLVSWIFDHIAVDKNSVDLALVVANFNKKVAEIEAVQSIALDSAIFFMTRIDTITQDALVTYCAELDTAITLASRTDAVIGNWYLVVRQAAGFKWATLQDVAGDQEGLMPALQYHQDFQTGAWRTLWQTEDHILVLDNKSVTHRPDMWGHRGVAREIAAYMEWQLKPIDALLHQLPVHDAQDTACIDAHTGFTVRVSNVQAVRRFAAVALPHVNNQSSDFKIALRLASVGARPIDALVDATNYVMFDLSQPLHAFDANAIHTKLLQPMYAQDGQEITLLDEQSVPLIADDLVITDGQTPLALAGIMGGAATGVHAQTTSIIIEAASFDPTTIRKTAARVKKRTEASARFEKNLDPTQNIQAIERFVFLLDIMGITYTINDIYSFGTLPTPTVLEISHTYIEQQIGATITVDKIMQIMRALECDVVMQQLAHDTVYTVHVPTWRATKDVRTPRDMLEEIARIFGYDALALELPRKQTQVSDVQSLYQMRAIKQLFAFGFSMHEVYNYAIFDQTFLHQLRWQPEHAIRLQNPVSEHWQGMVTSLVPHLLKNVVQHHETNDQLRFFEWARIWPQADRECAELAAIWYDKQQEISFYTLQDDLLKLFNMIGMEVSFARLDNPVQPWFAPYQSAAIMHHNVQVGTCGLMNKSFVYHVLPHNASVAVCTLDGDILRAYRRAEKRFVPLVKYPAVTRDMSMMVPLRLTVADLITALQSKMPGIKQITLIDTFHKAEWLTTKSITIRCVLQDEHKTLSGQDVDQMYAQMVQVVSALGAEVR